jgi:hypothetical protein
VDVRFASLPGLRAPLIALLRSDASLMD